MKTRIDAELCVGCGLCVEACPDVFMMEENIAQVKTNPVPVDAEESCKKAKDDCPVEAIGIEE